MNNRWSGYARGGVALALVAGLATTGGCVEYEDERPQYGAPEEYEHGGHPGESDYEPRSFDLCGEELTESTFAEFLDGNLVIVAAFYEQGSSKSRAIAELAVMMVWNGIDFGQLGSGRPSFSDGRYSLKTGESEVGFELFFSQDFEPWSAGDPIPYDVFDPDSYAKNVHLDVDTSSFPPEVTLDYDLGPLAGLVDGAIEIDEDSLSVKVRLRTDRVDIQVDSGSPYDHVWEPGDSLWLQMTTTRVNLVDMLGDLQEAGFGFSYDQTTYEAPQSDMEQEFYDSEFLTLRQANGNYRWEGGYRSTVTKGGLTMFQDGFASNGGGNHTDYFCDPELTQKVGTAEHDDSLLFGAFVFESGERFLYGIW